MFNFQHVGVPFNYRATVVDTTTDRVVFSVRSRTIGALSEAIYRGARRRNVDVFSGYEYDPTGRYVLYVADESFGTPEGQEKLQALYDEHHANVIQEILEDYGLDMDIWYELYLTDAERAAYDTYIYERTHTARGNAMTTPDS